MASILVPLVIVLFLWVVLSGSSTTRNYEDYQDEDDENLEMFMGGDG